MKYRVEPDPLRECPFCGSRIAPGLYQEEESNIVQLGYVVLCDASTDLGLLGCGANGGWGDTKAQAIDKWNRRSS